MQWTPVDGEALFCGPAHALSVSGGTAAFYRVELKEPHPVTGSKSYYIAKDLAHATDEVLAHACLRALQGEAGPCRRQERLADSRCSWRCEMSAYASTRAQMAALAQRPSQQQSKCFSPLPRQPGCRRLD